jgi:ADP-glucose pyrophosphorylase
MTQEFFTCFKLGLSNKVPYSLSLTHKYKTSHKEVSKESTLAYLSVTQDNAHKFDVMPHKESARLTNITQAWRNMLMKML